jgi:hypothetical protein
MSRTTKFYETPDEAIRSAKKRAKSTYMTQYIYQQESGLCVRNVLIESEGPVMKVLFDGTICLLNRAQKLQKAATFEDIAREVGMRYEPGWDYAAGQEVPHMHVFHTDKMDSRSCWINHVFHFAGSVQECLGRKLQEEVNR